MKKNEFRAKGLKGDDWYYGYFYVDEDGLPRILEHETKLSKLIKINTLCLCTGVVDINDNEIYEFDLIEAGHTTYTVEWDKYGLAWIAVDTLFEENVLMLGELLYSEDVEVYGNVFD